MFKNFRKSLLATSVATLTLGSASAAFAADTVALLLPEYVNPRWEQQDATAFVEKMAEIAPEVTVEVFNANNDTSVQQRQTEQALKQGASVLVVIPIDGESSAIVCRGHCRGTDVGARAAAAAEVTLRLLNDQDYTDLATEFCS